MRGLIASDSSPKVHGATENTALSNARPQKSPDRQGDERGGNGVTFCLILLLNILKAWDMTHAFIFYTEGGLEDGVSCNEARSGAEEEVHESVGLSPDNRNYSDPAFIDRKGEGQTEA